MSPGIAAEAEELRLMSFPFREVSNNCGKPEAHAIAECIRGALLEAEDKERLHKLATELGGPYNIDFGYAAICERYGSRGGRNLSRGLVATKIARGDIALQELLG